MKSDPEIENGIKADLKIRAFRVKGNKVFVKIRDPKIALNDIATVDLENPEITEHMGQKFVELVSEESDVIFLPMEKYNEIKQWAKEHLKNKEAESNARNTQNKVGSAELPSKESK